MKHEPKKYPLCEALEDLLKLQDMLTNAWSKYYGHLFIKLLGTDTIPFVLMTSKSTFFRLTDSVEQFETIYFRLESIEQVQKRIHVTLLRAFDVESNETDSLNETVRLEKTMAKASIDLRWISAIQLVDTKLFGREFYVESKW